MKTRNFIYAITLLFFLGCSKDDGASFTDSDTINQPLPNAADKSGEKRIISFIIKGYENTEFLNPVEGTIDEIAKTIAAKVPSGAQITTLETLIEISEKATISPEGPQDFTNPVTYTVTAEDGTASSYEVSVSLALTEKEILLLLSEVNSGNTLGWDANDELKDWTQLDLNSEGMIVSLLISDSGLSVLPPEIGDLEFLEVLELYKNELMSLPVEIGQLRHLSKLDINKNQLLSIPKEIGALEYLKYLNLNNNKISVLPEEIGNCKALLEIRIVINQLTSIPSGIGSLPNLKSLALARNQIKELPSEIGDLSTLEGLYLNENEIALLPKEIAQLSNLNFLVLSQNKISSIPKEIGMLQNLTNLLLDENELKTIPREIEQLQSLTHLSLRNNQLSSSMVYGLPKELGQLSNLEFLYLDGNPNLLSMRKEICNLEVQGTTEIDVVPGIVCTGDPIATN